MCCYWELSIDLDFYETQALFFSPLVDLATVLTKWMLQNKGP